TPDAEIQPVCERLAPRLGASAAVIHFSGATSVHALDAARGPTACVHPLQTVWPELGPDQLETAYAAGTGDATSRNHLALERGTPPSPRANKNNPTSPAASRSASNYLITTSDVAAELLERAGLERHLAVAALRPLQERTLLVVGRPPTGPIARGDAGTVAAHIE